MRQIPPDPSANRPLTDRRALLAGLTALGSLAAWPALACAVPGPPVTFVFTRAPALTAPAGVAVLKIRALADWPPVMLTGTELVAAEVMQVVSGRFAGARALIRPPPTGMCSYLNGNGRAGFVVGRVERVAGRAEPVLAAYADHQVRRLIDGPPRRP